MEGLGSPFQGAPQKRSEAVMARTEKTLLCTMYRVDRAKNTSYITSVLRAYPVLVKLLRAKHGFVVKARDICWYLGICDHYTITCLGRLLSLLSRMGLATRLNNSRPVHYALDPMVFLRYIEICRIERGEDYCIETGCSGLGICPYWQIRKALQGRE